MNKIIKLYQKIEKLLSGPKFAVIIITLFALSLVYGTFMESFHGTEYANRLVYKSVWFIGIEVCMFISIFMAVVVRLPYKRRLRGFYTIHAGLMTLWIGSLFTYINGIDGSIQIIPNTPSKKISIDEANLKITIPHKNKSYTLALPFSAGASNVGREIEGITINNFLPFAQKIISWKKSRIDNKQVHSGQYLVFNENVSQEFTLSLNLDSDFKSTLNIGLLSIHYMPSVLENCLTTKSRAGMIIWNLETAECSTMEEKGIKINQTPNKTRFITFNYKGENLKFFPDYSPVAINDDRTKNLKSPFRVLSLKIFEKKPNLFIFGEKVAFFSKFKKKWLLKPFDIKKGGLIALPWMGFQLKKLKFSDTTFPIEVPSYVKPIQENGKVISGELKAVSVDYKGKSFWVRNDGPLEISNGDEKIRFEIVPKELNLPYVLTLTRFKMDKNPGTDDAASYESFVQLLDGRNTTGVEDHHVFMNNPLKYDDFTFYQSSYFPIGPEQFGSILTVNYDPGRFFKYLGCLLVVLGTIWHYIISRPKTKHDKGTKS